MRGPLDVHQRLLAAEVPHEIVHLSRRVSAAPELPDALGVHPASCAVVHVVHADGRPHAVVLAAGATWSPVRLAHSLRAGSVTAADARETSAVTEYTAGLVSPFALPDGLPVLVDAALLGGDVVYAAVGETTTAVKVRSRDLVTAARAVVDAVAAPVTISLPGSAADVGGFLGRFAISAV